MSSFLGSAETLSTDLPVFAIGCTVAIAVYATGVFPLPNSLLLACAVVTGYANVWIVRWIFHA